MYSIKNNYNNKKNCIEKIIEYVKKIINLKKFKINQYNYKK